MGQRPAVPVGPLADQPWALGCRHVRSLDEAGARQSGVVCRPALSVLRARARRRAGARRRRVVPDDRAPTTGAAHIHDGAQPALQRASRASMAKNINTTSIPAAPRMNTPGISRRQDFAGAVLRHDVRFGDCGRSACRCKPRAADLVLRSAISSACRVRRPLCSIVLRSADPT